MKREDQVLIEHRDFDRDTTRPGRWQYGTIFRYCTFSDLAIEGFGIDGATISCTLKAVDWYWGLFNLATIVDTSFVDCTFRGTSFMDTRFVGCRFEGCRFVLDNLGGPCTFKDCAVVECSFDRCEFVLDNHRNTPVFTATRWYGCTQAKCRGLDAQF